MCLNINHHILDNSVPENIVVEKDNNGKEFFYGYKIVSIANRPPYYPKLEYKVGENFSDRERKEISTFEFLEQCVQRGIHVYTDYLKAKKIKSILFYDSKIIRCVCYLDDVIAFGFNDEAALMKVTVESLDPI